ncbi:MAG TPA: PAAR domain-containing protein [Allosphingosinicella sp.]
MIALQPSWGEALGQPAARIGDMHVCPMVNPGPVPHVGGPILPPCAVTVMTGGIPQARVTDLCVCVGPPDVIVKGSSTVLVSGLPAARMGDNTAHGGVIVVGLPTVLIGDAGGGGAGDFAGGNAAAQAAAMTAAAVDGKAFCEVCYQQAQARRAAR